MEELKEFVKRPVRMQVLPLTGCIRVLAVDEEGNVVDGDQIMAILGLDQEKRKFFKDTQLLQL